MNPARLGMLCGVGLLGLAVLAGCQTTDPVKAPPGGYQDPIPNKDYPYITVEWPLQEYLVVSYDGIVEERGGGGVPMAVQVPVRSMADTQLFFQYRFQWFDDSGRLVSEGGWKRQPVDARLQTQLQGNARTSNVSSWRLEVRNAR